LNLIQHKATNVAGGSAQHTATNEAGGQSQQEKDKGPVSFFLNKVAGIFFCFYF